jgi:predicted O-methyltransferase YrrM
MSGRSFRHWKPRYIIDRLQLMLSERIYADYPWLCAAAVQILNSWLKPTDQGLEWGSGRSTLWFAMRVAHLISVEHDPEWATTVKRQLCSRDLANKVDHRLSPDGKEGISDCNYVNVIRDIGPGSLDFCLIDGVCRDHCALACLDKLRPGGILIVDNAEIYLPRRHKSRAPNSRDYEDGYASVKWEQFAKMVANWRNIWITNGVWDTALWIKAYT